MKTVDRLCHSEDKDNIGPSGVAWYSAWINSPSLKNPLGLWLEKEIWKVRTPGPREAYAASRN